MVRGPHIITFQHHGNTQIGYLDVADFKKLIPFDVKRAFWVYHASEHLVRGNHAHHETELVLIALAGKIDVATETMDGTKDMFTLNQPDKGIYLPPHLWRTMKYSPDAVQLVFASTTYEESDYIKDHEQFKKMYT